MEKQWEEMEPDEKMDWLAASIIKLTLQRRMTASAA